MIVDLPCSVKGCGRRSRRDIGGRRWCELHGPSQPTPVLFKRLGENSTTPPDAVGPPPEDPAELAALLAQEADYCLDPDDNRLVRLRVYEVREVELPWGMTAADFARDGVGLKWWRAYGGPELSEPAMGRLARLQGAEKWHCARLLAADPRRMRAPFRIRMREKVLAWATAEPQPSPSPLLPQEVAALETEWDARARAAADLAAYLAR